MPRVSNEYGVLTCFRSKMQTKIILRPLPIIIPGNLHCKFGAWQNSEVAGLTGDCAK